MGPLIEFRDGFALWLPLLFGVMLIVMVWLMWRMLKLMPQVKPAEVDTKSKSAVTWADVAGVDEVRAELQEVVVMGASNRLQDLDPALLRPGRFDRQIFVSEPDLKAREAILAVHTRGKPLAPEIDLGLIARQTAGLTGAELANIANEAAIYAGRNQQPFIRQAEFDA